MAIMMNVFVSRKFDRMRKKLLAEKISFEKKYIYKERKIHATAKVLYMF